MVIQTVPAPAQPNSLLVSLSIISSSASNEQSSTAARCVRRRLQRLVGQLKWFAISLWNRRDRFDEKSAIVLGQSA